MREVISLHIGQAGTWNVAKENAPERDCAETEKGEMQVKDDARSEKRLFVSSPSLFLSSFASRLLPFLDLFHLVLDAEAWCLVSPTRPRRERGERDVGRDRTRDAERDQ